MRSSRLWVSRRAVQHDQARLAAGDRDSDVFKKGIAAGKDEIGRRFGIVVESTVERVAAKTDVVRIVARDDRGDSKLAAFGHKLVRESDQVPRIDREAVAHVIDKTTAERLAGEGLRWRSMGGRGVERVEDCLLGVLGFEAFEGLKAQA